MVCYLPRWSPRAGLNRRPHPYQGCALPLSYKGTSQIDDIECNKPEILPYEGLNFGKLAKLPLALYSVNTYF